MHRTWIYMALGFGVSMSTTLYIREMRARIDHLESAPRVEPSEVSKLRTRLSSEETRLASSMDELAKLREADEHAAAISRRVDDLDVEMRREADQLTAQHAKLQAFDQLKDEIGPSALDRRIDAFKRVAQDDWRHVDQIAREAMGLAESTKKDVDHLEKSLERDQDRMWRDLVGPTVQLTGDDTVGSGVLLASEPIGDAKEGGAKEFRTYLVTAWHVVRDIQNGSESAKNPVPVTIYSPEHHISTETAELVKYDATIDVAVLKLDTTRQIECGARLAPRSRLDQVKIFEQVYAVGCPLGNDPIPTFGEIADTHHVVDGSHYWMISAPTYIGNSGGGIYDAQTHELLGIFSKIYTHGSLRPTVVPHMGLVTSLKTIYDWMDTVGLASLEAQEDSVRAQTASAKR
jgi:S1-C subfamily serine protease